MAKKKQAPTKPIRKPKGFGKFSGFMQKLIEVPKEEIERLEAERKAAESK